MGRKRKPGRKWLAGSNKKKNLLDFLSAGGATFFFKSLFDVPPTAPSLTHWVTEEHLTTPTLACTWTPVHARWPSQGPSLWRGSLACLAYCSIILGQAHLSKNRFKIYCRV